MRSENDSAHSRGTGGVCGVVGCGNGVLVVYNPALCVHECSPLFSSPSTNCQIS